MEIKLNTPSTPDHDKRRSAYIDMVKGFAIYLVVFGHCIEYGSHVSIDKLYFDDFLFKLTSTFRMPLFMLICGYLFYFSTQKYSNKTLFRKKIQTLVIPVVVWNTIYLVLQYFYGFNYSCKELLETYVTALWFLWAVFWCSLLVLFVRKFFNDNIALYVVIFILSGFIPNKYGFQLYVWMYPFFIVGYLVGKYNLAKLLPLTRKMLIGGFLLSFVIFIILFYNFKTEYNVFISGTYIIRNYTIDINQILINLYRCIIGFVGSVQTLLLIYFFYLQFTKHWIANAFRMLGIHSIGIYLINRVVYNDFVIPYIPNRLSYGYFEVFIETTILVAIAYGISEMLRKNEYIKLLMFGGR